MSGWSSPRKSPSDHAGSALWQEAARARGALGLLGYQWWATCLVTSLMQGPSAGAVRGYRVLLLFGLTAPSVGEVPVHVHLCGMSRGGDYLGRIVPPGEADSVRQCRSVG